MHRLLVDSAELAKDAPSLTREAANHLRVVRPKDGEEIELFDGRGRWRVYRCRELGAKSYELRSDNSTTHYSSLAAPRSLTLFACVTKGSRWDWTIEKATELGVTSIVPVISERTIVRIARDERAAKRERWQRIAEDAARQSDAKWLPEITEPVDFADSLALVRETTCFVGALTTPPPQQIAAALAHLGPQSKAPNHFSVFVGPEGDFTAEELSSLLEIATPVSFGPTILRAETAAIFGLSVVKAFLDVRVG